MNHIHTLPDGAPQSRAGPPGTGPELCHWRPLSLRYPHHRTGRVQSNISARHRSALNSPSQLVASPYRASVVLYSVRAGQETTQTQGRSFCETDGLRIECSGAIVVVLWTVSRCLCSCLLALAKSSKLVESEASDYGSNDAATCFRRCSGSLSSRFWEPWSSRIRRVTLRIKFRALRAASLCRQRRHSWTP